MADKKENYSNSAHEYITSDVLENKIDKERFDRSKEREKKYNNDWSKQKVNLNDVVNMFIPESEGFIKEYSQGSIKFIYEGLNYIIKCDKVAGYLRIYDKNQKMYCLLDGTPSSDDKKTHFKIKQREEM